MNTNDVIDHSNTLHVDARPVSLHLPTGTAIFAVQGEVWLTQEGMARDIILGAGQRFDVPNRNKLVISSTRDSAALFIAAPDAARANRQRDVYDFARNRAAQLRQGEITRLIDTLASRLQSFAARLRGARLVPRTSVS